MISTTKYEMHAWEVIFLMKYDEPPSVESSCFGTKILFVWAQA